MEWKSNELFLACPKASSYYFHELHGLCIDVIGDGTCLSFFFSLSPTIERLLFRSAAVQERKNIIILWILIVEYYEHTPLFFLIFFSVRLTNKTARLWLWNMMISQEEAWEEVIVKWCRQTTMGLCRIVNLSSSKQIFLDT